MAQYLTKQGLEKLKKELEYLKNVKRKEIAKTLEHTASFGDLKENFAYHQAKDDQAFLEGRILELEGIIREVKIIGEKKSDVVQLGSRVTLEGGGEKQTFQILGREEANPSEGRISFESPLGQAIFGKSEGDRVELATVEGKRKYKIVKIE
jgi:transcription elongation factor GreA